MKKAAEILQDGYLERLVALIVDHYQPTRIYLFGSRARGDNKANSDYDLLVLLKKKIPWMRRRKFHRAKWDANLCEATDIVMITEKSFEEQKKVKISFANDIAREAKLLYEAT